MTDATRGWGRLVVALAALGALGGCSDDPAGPSGGGDVSDTRDVAPDAAPTGRSFLLAGRAEAYDINAPAPVRPWVPSLETLGDDLAEAVVIPLDLYGIPWDSFTGPDNRPNDLPGPWFSAVNALKSLAESSGRPIVLALSPLATAGDTLAADAREQNGALILNPSRHAPCYNPAADGNPTKWRDAWAGYAVWAVRQFEPRWVILGQRVNRYEERCGVAPYEAVLDYPAEAHRRIKALTDVAPLPTTIVGVDVEDLYGYPQKPGRCVATTPEACFATRAPLLAGIEADLLGLESYPAFALEDLASLPSDWLTRVADARDDLGGAIIGTHLPAVSLSRRGGVCTPLLDSSEAAQSAWLDQVINAATTRRMELVVWRSLRDLLPADVVSACPCAGDVAVCQHLEQLNASADDVRRMVSAGLVDVDGAERPAASVWRQTLLID